MTAALLLVPAAVFLVLVLVIELRRRRRDRRALERARARLIELGNLQPPEAIPSVELTKADRRRALVRRTPRAHKRRTGNWG